MHLSLIEGQRLLCWTTTLKENHKMNGVTMCCMVSNIICVTTKWGAEICADGRVQVYICCLCEVSGKPKKALQRLLKITFNLIRELAVTLFQERVRKHITLKDPSNIFLPFCTWGFFQCTPQLVFTSKQGQTWNWLNTEHSEEVKLSLLFCWLFEENLKNPQHSQGQR